MVYDWVSYLGWCKLNPKWLVNGMVYTDLLGQNTLHVWNNLSRTRDVFIEVHKKL